MQEIYNAEDIGYARKAIAAFEKTYGAKYPKAVAKIVDDADVLLEFYHYPAEHWTHLRTTNPIELTFATVRLRTKVTKGPGSRAAGLAMAYKLIEAAQVKWRAVNVKRPGFRSESQQGESGMPRSSVQSCVSVPCAWSTTAKPARAASQHRSVPSRRSSVSAQRRCGSGAIATAPPSRSDRESRSRRRNRRLRRELAEARRANEILKAASAFFAAELDRPTTK